MIMTQDQSFGKAQQQLLDLIAFVRQATQDQQRLDQVERGLFTHLLQLGLSLLTAFVAAAGDGDVGDTTTTAEGTPCRRLPQPHERTYRSLFGTLPICRFVYGSREGQKIEHVPLDAVLGCRRASSLTSWKTGRNGCASKVPSPKPPNPCTICWG